MSETVLENISWMQASKEIDAIDASTLTEDQFIKNYVGKSRPLIIRGAITHWPAMKKWTDPVYLAALCGDQCEYFYPHSNYMSTPRMKIGEEIIPFSEGIRRIFAGTGEQVMSMMPSVDKPCSKLIGTFKELLVDIGEFPFLRKYDPPYQFPEKRAFIYRGAETSWHRHFCDETLLCQVIGSKRIGLLNDDGSVSGTINRMLEKEGYLDDPDSFRSVDCSRLSPWVATIHEGDALYIPPFWWHGVSPVQGNSAGISVAHAWKTPPEIMGNLANPLVWRFWLSMLLTFDKLALQFPFVAGKWIRSRLFPGA